MPRSIAPLRSRKPAGERGYIDNRPVVVIVLVLAALAISSYFEQTTGKGLDDLFGELTPLALWFIGSVCLVGIGGLFAVHTVATATLGEPRFPVVEAGGGPAIVYRNAATVTGGGYLGVMGLLFTGFGLTGTGWQWSLIALAGLVAVATGITQFGRRERWRLCVDGIVRERCTYGRASPIAEWRWQAGTRPSFEIVEQSSGGAFGQPLVERHAVVLDGRELFDSHERELALAFLHALQGVYDAMAVDGSGVE